jgi:hypothetical protein
MKKCLDELADRGCWISDDRVYLFLSEAGVVGEVGYHGKQPVSKNSRILVRGEGALGFSLRMSGGEEHKITFPEVDWTPASVACSVELQAGIISFSVRAAGRTIFFEWSGKLKEDAHLLVHLAKGAFFRDVHGERLWSAPSVTPEGLLVKCRDRIRFRPWIARKGPYAGDFLIPEPWRHLLFAGGKRSGSARAEDLRSEFRDVDFALYDAEIYLHLGGEGFSCSETPGGWLFRRFNRAGEDLRASFRLEFADEESKITPGVPPDPDQVPRGRDRRVPRLHLERYPRWEEFYATAPGLVDSCRVRDLGVLRATPGGYYWIWAWDMLVAVHEALRWGDLDLCHSTLLFANRHRDTNGIIPARWTRSLQPLDTPSPGGIEFLLASLAYELSLEAGERGPLAEVFTSMHSRFREAAPGLRSEGVARGEGFYPDLLTAFGREPGSAVAMETGSWYALCRILAAAARQLGESATESEADACAKKVAEQFLKSFWDDVFLVDSLQTQRGKKSGKHPLFALLFLHSPLGLSIIRERLTEAADFIEQRLLSEHGVRLLPKEESKEGGETVLDSWYPHWDQYALKLLRRAGRARAIMAWLEQSEHVLENLGYCPEFLSLSGFRGGDPSAWRHHGAASNLNCVTGWYRALRESVFGVEFDPGGMTHIPLGLPLGRIAMEDLHWRGGNWSLEVNYGGPDVVEISVDGKPLKGCMKIPIGYASSGRHTLKVNYGRVNAGPRFLELVNAEVHRSEGSQVGAEVEISTGRSLLQCDQRSG